jgi:hypothetical protein
LARLEAKSFECAMHRLGTILSWQHHWFENKQTFTELKLWEFLQM